jgi:Zn-dependent protease with chaperone function
MAEQRIKGRLALGAIDDEAGKERLFGFLQQTLPKASTEKLETLILNPKASLVLTIRKDRVPQLLQKLNNLGAKARFSPLDGQSKAKPSVTGVNIDRVKTVVLGGFQEKIEDVSISFFYRAGLAVTAFIMLLLPVIYLSMIAGIGYLLVFHTLENVDLFDRIGSGKAALMAYVGPIIIGSLMLLFMVKPLFARRRFQDNSHPLDSRKEPFLYAYVNKVAEMLGAPMPSKIYAVMEVNAYAALKPGMKSFFTNELELTIGLPLAAGANLHQLTEIIGHELGHFAQTAGMRFSFIIRRVNGWFARVVYEKDNWDMRIKRWSSEWDIRLSIFLYLARFFIWLTRRILWALMWVGEAVSCFMMRQMEYDADRHGLALIGADVFQSSSERLGILSWAHNWANNDLGSAWKEGRLVDNYPALIRSRANQIPPKEKEEFLRSYLNETDKKIFDTHPCTADRIAHARKHDKPPKYIIDTGDPDMQRYLVMARRDDPDGLYQSSPPAAVLFTNFRDTSIKGTSIYYEAVLGKPVPEDCLIPYDRLIKSREQEDKEQEALEEVFAGLFNLYREPEQFVLPLSAPENTGEAITAIAMLKAEMEKMKESYAQAVGTYSKIDDRMRLLAQASALKLAGFKIKANDFKLARGDQKTISETQANSLAEEKKLFIQMKGFESKAYKRIANALSLLAKTESGGGRKMRIAALKYMRSWNALAEAHGEVVGLERLSQKLLILAHQLDDSGNDEKLINELRNLSSLGHSKLSGLKTRFAGTAYPFEHADNDMSMGQYVIGEIPSTDELGYLLDTMENGVQTYFTLLNRLAAKLADMVVRIEKDLNIV